MASVKFYLDVPFKKDLDKAKLDERIKKCKQDNKPYPESILNDRETSIYLIMNVEGKLLKVKTKEKILPKWWQFDKEEKIKSSYNGSIELNEALNSIKNEVLKHYRALVAKDKSISFEELKAQVTAIVKGETLNLEKDFVEVFKSFIEVQSKDQEKRTIQKYKTTLELLKEFSAKKKLFLSFENIDLHFYDSFMLYLLKSKTGKYKDLEVGFLNDSIAKHFSVIKTFMQWALERKYHSNTDFRSFKATKKTRNEIVTLTADELLKIFNLDLSSNPRLERVRNVFCFACFTGQRFSDIEAFNPADVKDNTWKFISIKTKKLTRVPLTGFIKPAKDILDKYNGSLPKISNQKFNAYLKELGKMAEIFSEVEIVRYSGKKEIKIKKQKWEFMSSHMARRTCVTYLLERNVAATTIMLLTSHGDLKTLLKYNNTQEDALTRELDRVGPIDEPIMKVAK